MEKLTDYEILYLTNLLNTEIYKPILFTKDNAEEQEIKKLKIKLINIMNERKK